MKKSLFTLLFVLFFAVTSQAASVSVSWGPASEPDASGYKLYLVNQSNASDIKLLADVKVPAVTANFTVTVVGAGNYVVVGSVYDLAGNESVKSAPAVDGNNQVAVFKDSTPPGTMQMLKITSISDTEGAAAAAVTTLKATAK